MLKRLIAITLACAIPVPRQSPHPPTQAPNYSEAHSPAENAPSHSPIPINGPVKSDTSNPHSGQAGTDNKEQKISVVSIPTVSVAQPTKSFGDHILEWGPWLFNLLLVLVGTFQVWLLYRTWEKVRDQEARMAETVGQMKIQAEWMEAQVRQMGTQTVILNDSVTASEKSAEAGHAAARAAQGSADAAIAQIRIMKDQERGRLAIRFIEQPEISGPDSILEGKYALRVYAFVENLGRTKAFDVRAYGIVDIVSNPRGTSHDIGFLQDFPQIIDEGQKTHLLKLGGFGRAFEDFGTFSGGFTAIDEEIVQKTRNGTAFIQVSGALHYDDIFGDPQSTTFMFVWRSVGDDDGGKWLTRSFWLDCSPRYREEQKPNQDKLAGPARPHASPPDSSGE